MTWSRSHKYWECQNQDSRTGSLTAKPEASTTSLNSFSSLDFLSQIHCKGEWLLIRILKLISTWVPLIPSLDNFMPTRSLNVFGSQWSRAPAVVQCNCSVIGLCVNRDDGTFKSALGQALEGWGSLLPIAAVSYFHKVKQVISSL